MNINTTKKSVLDKSWYSCNASHNNNTQNGFTLVELIVSMALFILVIFIVTSTFLNLSQLHKTARATMVGINSVSVAIENMARNIRIGDTYSCNTFYGNFYPNRNPPITGPYYPKLIPQDCPSGNTSILFYVPDGSAPEKIRLTGYYYRSLSESSNPGSIQGRENICCSYLTSPDNIKITNLTFYVTGTQTSSVEQPRVLIVLQGETKTTPASKFKIYTSVTQRSSK